MANPQLVLLVRFPSTLSKEEVTRVARERMPDFRALPGLRQKYYLHDEQAGEYAGLYVWDSPRDLEEFNASELRATIAETYGIAGAPRIEVYGIIDVLREDE